MSNTLDARRLNHGQSEIWLGDESKRRTVPTNTVSWTVRRNSSKEEYEAFYAALHAEMGNVAEVFAAGKIVEELSLTG